MKRNRLSIALGLIGTSALMGCGDSDSASTSPTPPSTTTPSVITTYDVTAIDGYLQNANVWLDLNSNYLLDDAEPSVRSGGGGVAKLDVSGIENYEDYPIVVQAIAGETIDIGIDINDPENNPVNTSYMMSAPAGETDVTPLSTLVHVILEQQMANEKNDLGRDELTPAEVEALKEKAKSQVADQLGIDKEDVLGDFIGEGNNDVAFAAENIVNSNILPEEPEGLAGVVEEAKLDDPDDNANDSSFLAKNSAASSLIKSTIETVQENTADGEEQDFSSEEEVFDGTQDSNTDTDSDSVPDFIDAFPNDPDEWVDTDGDGRDANGDLKNPIGVNEGDGYGDNSDLDDDGDGINDIEDAFPLNKHESLDSDNDYIGNNADTDDDNDGYLDESDGSNNLVDVHPLDNTKAGDHDGDSIDSIDDAFPSDASKAGDFDGDGVDFVIDEFRNNPNEWVDADGDSYGDNLADKFPSDINNWSDADGDGYGDETNDAFLGNTDEWVDADGDSYGDNLADKFPSDINNWSDADGDGYGDETDDAYVNDPTKAVADVDVASTYTTPYVDDLTISVQIVDASSHVLTEQFLDDTIKTTTNIVYRVGTITYGTIDTVEIIDTKPDTDTFSRVTHYSFDYNLDGDTQFEGKLFEIGDKQANGETYWRYIDEADGSAEDVSNGEGRNYNSTDFSSMLHPVDLSGIDTIHNVTVTYSVTGLGSQTTISYDQFDVSGFDYQDTNTHIVNFMYSGVRTVDDEDKLLAYSKQEDWQADDTNNELLTFVLDSDTAYTFTYERPVWATPNDGIVEEYADYNFNPGNTDNLTSHWYKETATVDFNTGENSYHGYRYVLDEQPINSPNIKLVDGTHTDGYLFSEWSATKTDVHDTEFNEAATWAHYHLDNYDFTAPSESIGQNYTVHIKQDNGIWLSYVFSEWESQSIGNLASNIETFRSGGTDINDITTGDIVGLSNIAINPNRSFRYDALNQPVQWYLVTNNSELTTGEYTKLPVTLTDNGLKDGWLVYNTNSHLFVAKPIDTNNVWDWYDAYTREEVTINDIELNLSNFSWTSNLGQFFLDESLAQAQLDSINNDVFNVCTNEDIASTGSNADNYADFAPAATNCGYSAFNQSTVENLTIYTRESATEYNGYTFNTGGSGTYMESNGYTVAFNWMINAEGIIHITDTDNDETYLALIDTEDNRFSILAFYTSGIGDETESEIIGQEFTTTPPTVAAADAEVIQLIKDEGTLYSFWDDDFNALLLETIVFDGVGSDTVSLTSVQRVLENQVLTDLSLNFDMDRQLSSSGWIVPQGYRFDMSGDVLTAHPGSDNTYSYSVSGTITDLEGEVISSNTPAWENFIDDNAVFANGAKRIDLEMTANSDIYYLWENSPWVMQPSVGHAGDNNTTSTLNEIISSTSAGALNISGVSSANILRATSMDYNLFVEFVDGGEANYYSFEQSTDQVTKIGVGLWTRETINSEDILTYTITEVMINQFNSVTPGIWTADIEDQHRLFSVYDGRVYAGEFEPEGSIDDGMVIYNATAKVDILAQVSISCGFELSTETWNTQTFVDRVNNYLQCTDSTSTVLSQVDILDLVTHKVNDNDEERSYYYHSDGTLTYVKGDEYKDRKWRLENIDGLSVLTQSSSDGTVDFDQMVLLSRDDNTLTYAYYWGEDSNESELRELTDVSYRSAVSECDNGNTDWDDTFEQPSPFATVTDFDASVTACGLTATEQTGAFTSTILTSVTTWTINELETVNGTTAVFPDEKIQFSDTMNGAFVDDEDGSFPFSWQVDNGLVSIVLNDLTDTASGKWALIETDNNNYSVKVFWQESEWTNPAPNPDEGEISSFILIRE
ncbi:hypothetical protein [Vibrio sp. VB16]|uniref:hypothetical protein n=1 Tax=Vibrio sp. VB16 TaxID=2785746 RepID=UPI00189C6232|nr:hypothetical protein [Vibrio sp. VB16]UGA53926.1 hypothetical protein IUZ65_011590 [Vibrio sp. VB16]